MMRSSTSLLLALLAASCESSKYATFEPLREDVATDRVQREHFSMPVPKGWLVDDDPRTLTARETPPDNGRIRAYRRVLVEPIEVFAGADEGTRDANAMAYLRQRLSADGFVDTEAGRGEFAGRKALWRRGSLSRGSIDIRFDVWACVVPCRDLALYVEYSTPEGQFEAAQPGFSALARGFETDLAPPRGSGALVWFGGERFGFWVDDDWNVEKDVQGCAGVLTAKSGSLRCEVHVDEASFAADFEDYVDECCADLGRFGARLESLERGSRDGRSFACIRSVSAGETGGVVRNSVVMQRGRRVDSVQFVVPCSEWASVRASVERAAASARGKE